jgi:glucan endo-1,3-beta-D-glucosidase
MRFSSTVLAAAALLSSAEAAYKGFNYGAFFGNNAAKQYADFKYEFEAAKGLPGTAGQFTSARLYTMIQHGTSNNIISAIQAAIDTQTTLLLGIWCSGATPATAQATVNNEIAALKAAISKHGKKFTDLVTGISVGSEDLYRITPTAIKNGEKNPGAQPAELVKYIGQVRSAIAGTGLAGKPIGHVDTWTAYVNGSNSAVVNALDFLGVDAYPYWEVEHANGINNAKTLFYDAYQQTKNAAKGKPIWVTETGWPVTGPSQGQAVANNANAKKYWNDVSCQLMRDNVNLYYYTLQDVQYSTPSPSFGIKPGGDLKAVKPLFDLTCPNSAKFVSYPFLIPIAFILSPLLLRLQLDYYFLSYLIVLPFARKCPSCDCSLCSKTSKALAHPPSWTERPLSWMEGANDFAKTSSTVTATTSNSSSGISTGFVTLSSSKGLSKFPTHTEFC